MAEKTVLLVDDDEHIDKMIACLFELKGIHMEVAKSGEEGLETLKRLKPAAIILDLMMPGMDGFEFCRQLKGKPETKDIPIIILSAYPTEENKERAMSLGASHFIEKPFRNNDLLNKTIALL